MHVGKWLAAIKRSAVVPPEVGRGECTLHLPLQKVNKTEPTLAFYPRNPNRGTSGPKKDMCQPKTLKKKL